LIDVVYSGDAVESIGPIPPPLKWVYDPTLQEQAFNPEKAKALLSKSKYSKKEINDMSIYVEGFGTGWWKRFAEVASYQISQVLGIEIKPRISEYGALVERVKVGSYSMQVIGFLGLVEVDEYLYDNYHTTGSLNQRLNRNYSNNEVDRLLDKGRQTLNLEERANYYKKAQKIIVEEAPDIFCFHANITQAFRENIKGFVQTAYNGYGAQFEEVWIE
jgi:peptide/nickel transport system substrate-binding protein